MTQRITISLADSVLEEIERRLNAANKKNRSELVEEMIRIGLDHTKQRQPAQAQPQDSSEPITAIDDALDEEEEGSA